MTRFARSSGSASSNERQPEAATPWAQLKAGLLMANPEIEDDLVYEKDQNENLDPRKKRSAQGHDDVLNSEGEDEPAPEWHSKALSMEPSPAAWHQKELLTEPEEDQKKAKNKRRKDRCLQCKEKGHLKMDCPTLTEERRQELRDLVKMKIERKGMGTGRKKNKNKKRKIQEESSNGNGNLEEVPQSKRAKVERKKRPLKKPMQKRERKDLSGQVVQEGEGVFQGFRVRKEDLGRLIGLQRELQGKGVEGEELNAAMKLERRRAEKALARFHKSLCFRCRQPGHSLAQCPLEKEAKRCFKCGSADHTSKECLSKRKGGDAYAFAVCFICKETGHLAKACPDNPRGIYPKGGGCRFCGSVEHLKSECPRKAEKDRRSEVRAATWADKGGLEEDVGFASDERKKKTASVKKKVVSF